MSCVGRSFIALLCALLASCSGSSENPLINGMTPELEALVIEKTIEQIEFAENFTYDQFEEIQRKTIETMVPEMRDAALANLKNRADKVAILEMSQTVQLDRDSAVVESRVVGPENVRALVILKGTRTYSTENASNTSDTRFSLPWSISVDDGELVFQHRGIRMRTVRVPPNASVDPALLETPDAPEKPGASPE